MDKQQAEKQTSFISLRVKLLVGFSLLFSVVFAGAFYWFDAFAQGMAMRQIESDLVKAVKTATLLVDGDELVALAREGVPNEQGFSDDPRYWRQIEQLKKVHEIDPHAWPYTYVKGKNPGDVIFITDMAAAYEPSKAVKFLELIPAQEGWKEEDDMMFRGFKELALLMTPYTDRWGTWVSGYAPIVNSKGEKVAGLGVDFTAEYVSEVREQTRYRVVLAFALAYSILLILLILVSRALTRPIVTLTEAARRVGDGDYGQDFSALTTTRFPDEIGVLAKVFELMVGKVHKREETLRHQVEELRIEIDEVKRKRQVAEITDTGFFRDLQDKARTMRSRKRGEGQNAPDGETPGSES
jgi:hypothetical protein